MQQGLTLPRLTGLLEAYAARRARELKETGNVVAMAMHQPKDLQKIKAPEKPPERSHDSSEWETDRWW